MDCLAFWCGANTEVKSPKVDFAVPSFEHRDGDYTEVAPPVPIPNTEVKYLKADDTRFNLGK